MPKAKLTHMVQSRHVETAPDGGEYSHVSVAFGVDGEGQSRWQVVGWFADEQAAASAVNVGANGQTDDSDPPVDRAQVLASTHVEAINNGERPAVIE